MSGPLFLRLRREGFAERAVVLLETEFSSKFNIIRVDKIEVVYDPQFDTWTQSLGPRQGWNGVRRACTHNGSAVVFFSDGLVLERDTDGSWSPYDVEEGIRAGDRNQTVFGSVLLG